MDPKKNLRSLSFVALVLLASSCAHRNRKGAEHTSPSAPPPSTTLLPSEVAKDLLPPDPMGSQELPPVNAPAAPAAPRSFGVWIDGAGLDSLSALGFLQELEHRGLKPAKVVGTGFGCWVAISWAFENSGNRAEWQSYKWSNWEALPRGGLLGKLTLGRAKKKFEQEMERLFPVKRFENLSLPADCPVVPDRRPVGLVSGRSWSLGTNLWYQLQIPALGFDPANSDFYSGLAAGVPQASELDVMAQDVPKDKNFGGWIVLRTRTAGERGGKGTWTELLNSRGTDTIPATGKTPSGLSWFFVDLAGEARQSEDIQKFEKRRAWMLEGRRIGNNFLERSEAKAFFE